MRVSALFVGVFAFAQRVEDTGILSQIMRVSAFAAILTEVFIIELFAGIFIWLWSGDLSLQGVREVTTEAVFAIAQVVVDAGVETSVDMGFAAFSFIAFIDSEVLVGAEVFNHFELTF